MREDYQLSDRLFDSSWRLVANFAAFSIK